MYENFEVHEAADDGGVAEAADQVKVTDLMTKDLVNVPGMDLALARIYLRRCRRICGLSLAGQPGEVAVSHSQE
jgi:hypothetical protein